jgi:hypothetical protein
MLKYTNASEPDFMKLQSNFIKHSDGAAQPRFIKSWLRQDFIKRSEGAKQ